MVPPWLAVVAPHGATDLIKMSIPKVLTTHAVTFGIVNIIPFQYRLHALPPLSVAHLRHDFSKQKWISSLAIHLMWAVNPNIAPYYLTLVHTPLHYKSSLLSNRWKSVFFIISFSLLLIPMHVEMNVFARLWVSPVLAHIILHEIAHK